MRVLITGVTGFAGGHLAEALVESGRDEVIGLSRQTQWPRELGHLAGRVELVGCDLLDAVATESLLRRARPHQVFHLAGYAQTGRVFWDAEVVWTSNLMATRRLYEAVFRWGGQPRILYVGSGMVYGDSAAPPGGQDEEAMLRPMSAYAASKAAADLLSYQLTRDPGMAIVRVRPFNHIGPRQSQEYAVAQFARQVAAIEAKRQSPVLETGDLTFARDLTDVRDVVRAYAALMERGRTGEVYNVGSGQAHTMKAVVDVLLSLSEERIEVRQRPLARRSATPALLRANAEKLRRETGWKPERQLKESLADILSYWREQMRTPQRG